MRVLFEPAPQRGDFCEAAFRVRQDEPNAGPSWIGDLYCADGVWRLRPCSTAPLEMDVLRALLAFVEGKGVAP